MTGFWPNFPDDDERRYHLDRAYLAATSVRQMDVEAARRAGEPPTWRPVRPDTTRALLRVVCSDHTHREHQRPMLAELWHTEDHGPLFLSKLPGAVFDPPDDPTDPFAPPTAVRSTSERSVRRRLLPRTAPPAAWEPVPITIVRLFLADSTTEDAVLWVKCTSHGAGSVDRLQLNRAYVRDQTNRQAGHDTREPTLIGLHDVGALSYW